MHEQCIMRLIAVLAQKLDKTTAGTEGKCVFGCSAKVTMNTKKDL